MIEFSGEIKKFDRLEWTDEERANPAFLIRLNSLDIAKGADVLPFSLIGRRVRIVIEPARVEAPAVLPERYRYAEQAKGCLDGQAPEAEEPKKINFREWT